MNTITLLPDGSLSDAGKPACADPLIYLGHKVELAPDYTLRSFFRMCEAWPTLTRFNSFLPVIMERYRGSASTGCTHGEFDFLGLAKTVEMIGFPGKPRLEIYMTFQGVRGKETSELRFLQMENLLDMPVRLCRLRHIVFGDKMDVMEFDTVYNFFEFIDGVGWELSFLGAPDQCAI